MDNEKICAEDTKVIVSIRIYLTQILDSDFKEHVNASQLTEAPFQECQGLKAIHVAVAMERNCDYFEAILFDRITIKCSVNKSNSDRTHWLTREMMKMLPNTFIVLLVAQNFDVV